MPIYEYKALNERGQTIGGLLDADTPREVRERLRGQKLFVTDINPIQEKARQKSSLFGGWFRRVSLGELATVTRQLATLLGSGIQLAQALQALIEQVQGTRFEPIIRDVREQIISGLSFGEALARHPLVFNELYVNMVKAGEASGSLDKVLQRVADYIQSQTRLQSRISAALAYPFVMVIIATGVVIFLMMKVVPDITALLKQQGQELPPITTFLVNVSDFIRAYWFMIPLGLFAIYMAWRAWVGTPQGRRTWDRMMLNLPVMGDMFRKVAVSRFAITMSTLLKSGLPALESLRIVRNVVRNQILADTLESVHDRILEGADISTPIKKSGVFPPVVGYMMAIGEQSGKLDELLDRISSAYDEEVELATQKMTSMLEPIMIVAMAAVVGFIVAAVMLPLLQMSSMAGKG